MPTQPLVLLARMDFHLVQHNIVQSLVQLLLMLGNALLIKQQLLLSQLMFAKLDLVLLLPEDVPPVLVQIVQLAFLIILVAQHVKLDSTLHQHALVLVELKPQHVLVDL